MDASGAAWGARVGGWGGLLILLSVTSQTQAQPSAHPAAEALLERGRELQKQGKLDEACPKFEEAYRLAPRGVIARALGSCYEGQNRLSKAWGMYREALRFARQNGARPETQQELTELVNGLYARLPRLVLVVPGGIASLPGFKVQRGGEPIRQVFWGEGLPVDPGEHEITATADGYQPWSVRRSVAVGDEVRIEIGPLVAAPVAPAVSSSASSAPPLSVEPAPLTSSSVVEKTSPSGLARGRVVALSLGGAGLMAMVAALYFDRRAGILDDEKRALCPSRCVSQDTYQQAVSRANDARSAQTIAGVSLGVGAALVVSSAALWWLSPSGSTVALQSAPGGGGLWVRGTW